MRKRIAAVSVVLLCLFGLFAGKIAVSAEEAAAGGQFSGDVSLIRRDNGNYVMQVTVENSGEDFSGTVQLIFGRNSGPGNCAYNTEISIPNQGKKQFTVTVTEGAVDTVRGMCTMKFLDGKGKVLQSIPFSNVFGSIVAGIPMGILSDDYSSLTYLDAGGIEINVGDLHDSLGLIELNRDNLMNYLDALCFLVIDHYNVSTLDEEQIRAIQKWVGDGGLLLLGTGAYAEETLSGFDKDFLNVSLLGISEPGEENALSIKAERQGYYYYYRQSGVDFSQMAIADLVDDRDPAIYMYEDSDHPAIYNSIGQGGTCIFYCSLGESSLQWLEDYMVRNMYANIVGLASYYQSSGGYINIDYIGQSALAFIDGQNTHLNFTVLELLIAFYVILVGPILYLILRKCKKSEWYWGGVPVLGLVFVLAVFLFGQGSRVNETRAYSITVQQADSDRADTYILAYHSGVKPWNIRLNDNYAAAGPGWNAYYSYYLRSNSAPDNYYYLVQDDGQGLSIGVNPQANFENAYFYAGAKAERKGSILADGLANFGVGSNISGTVTNNTVCDMAYMAVWHDSFVAVFSDVKAGETIDLRQADQDGRCVYRNSVAYFDDLFFDMISRYGTRTSRGYEQDDMAALLVGMGCAGEMMPMDGNYAVITGVVKNYDRAVTGKCNETAYGCLFSYAEVEVTGNHAVY